MNRFVVGAIVLVLVGCASTPFRPSPTLADLQVLIEQGEFGRALQIHATLDPQVVGQAEWKGAQSVLDEKISAYEQEVIWRVDELITEKKWEQALNVLRDGLHVIPRSESLSVKKEEVIQSRDQHRYTLLSELYSRQARTLLRNQKQVDELKKYHKADQHSQSVMRQSREQEVGLKNSLVELAKYYMEQERYDQAERCLKLAQKLGSDTSISSLIDRAKQRDGVQSDVGVQNKANEIRKIEWAISQGRLADAKKKLLSFEKLYPKEGRVPLLKARLSQQINEQVEKGLEAGRQEYQQRNIQRALAIWEPLLSLAPDHEELNRSIERANRILENLELISKEGEGG